MDTFNIFVFCIHIIYVYKTAILFTYYVNKMAVNQRIVFYSSLFLMDEVPKKPHFNVLQNY